MCAEYSFLLFQFLLSRVAPYAKQLGFPDYFSQILANVQNGVQARSATRTMSKHPTLIRTRGNEQSDKLDILQYIPMMNNWILLKSIHGYRFNATYCTILIDSDLYILGGCDRNSRNDLDLVRNRNMWPLNC